MVIVGTVDVAVTEVVVVTVVHFVVLEVDSEVLVVVGVVIDRQPHTVDATLDCSDLIISTPLFFVARASRPRFSTHINGSAVT